LKFIASRIRKFYKRKSVVVNPPVEINKFRNDRQKEDFYLCVSQLVSYKRVDLVVQAFNILNLPLCVAGGGTELGNIKKIAGENVQILGRVSDDILQEKMETCKAFVFAGKEDFGMVFVEALSAGSPVIAYGKGGAKEIIINHKTGILFREQSVDAIKNAVKLFNDGNLDLLSSAEISDIAKKYSIYAFKKSITDLLKEKTVI
jgi:glycosyltransferase involved in cell wall biosynthesis